MSTTNSENTRLKELGTSRFEVAQNESDIRGWTIKNSQGRILGKVSDLLFDAESEKYSIWLWIWWETKCI